jgi:hypothetical protein
MVAKQLQASAIQVHDGNLIIYQTYSKVMEIMHRLNQQWRLTIGSTTASYCLAPVELTVGDMLLVVLVVVRQTVR